MFDQRIEKLAKEYKTNRKRYMVNSRTKGNNWERKVVSLLNTWCKGEWTFRRSYSKNDEKCTGDITVLDPKRPFPLHIECRKNESWRLEEIVTKGENSTLVKWFLEKEKDKTTKRSLVYVFSKNMRTPIAMMRHPLFIRLEDKFGTRPGSWLARITGNIKGAILFEQDDYVFMSFSTFLSWIDPVGLDETIYE